jgi:hypothetical protein
VIEGLVVGEDMGPARDVFLYRIEWPVVKKRKKEAGI